MANTASQYHHIDTNPVMPITPENPNTKRQTDAIRINQNVNTQHPQQLSNDIELMSTLSYRYEVSSSKITDVFHYQLHRDPYYPKVFKIRGPQLDAASQFVFNVCLTIELASNPNIEKIESQLQLISALSDNWDGHGSKTPSDMTLVNVQEILEQLYNRVRYDDCLWITPFIYNDENQYISIEWRHNNRSLHFDVKDNSMEYTKIWKASNGNRESEDGYFNIQNCISLWNWLIDENR